MYPSPSFPHAEVRLVAWGPRVGTRLIFTLPLHLSRCIFSDTGANGGRKREAALSCGGNSAPGSLCFHLLLPLIHLCCSCALGIGGWQYFFSEGCSPKPPSIAGDIHGGTPMLAVSPPSITHSICPLGWPNRAWTAHHFCLFAKLSASSPSTVPVCSLPPPPGLHENWEQEEFSPCSFWAHDITLPLIPESSGVEGTSYLQNFRMRSRRPFMHFHML